MIVGEGRTEIPCYYTGNTVQCSIYLQNLITVKQIEQLKVQMIRGSTGDKILTVDCEAETCFQCEIRQFQTVNAKKKK